MSRILGLDLGTNSIGWAIRDTQAGRTIDQIIHTGVVVFEKGVGEGRAGEFSLAAQRSKARFVRKRYSRIRWRKIDLLSILIKHDMCPLTLEELAQWKTPSRKAARKYPAGELFRNWLRLDFNNDGQPDHANPFELREAALLRLLSPHETGRIIYHINQRRGYLSNRREREQDAVEMTEDREAELEKSLDGKTIGQQLSEDIRNGGRARRRSEEGVNIHRLALQAEFERIAVCQQLPPELSIAIQKVVFGQRPLKSPKNMVGKCIYEKDKARCPVSHPEYELFRMWQVLNYIKYSDDEGKTWNVLAPDERQLVSQKFFRRSNPVFDFSDISDIFRKCAPSRIFNFKDKQSIAGCPLLAGLIAVLGEQRTWELRAAALKRLEWESREKRSAAQKHPVKEPDLYDLWHWLLAMDNEKDQQIIHQKVREKLGFSEAAADKFIRIPVKQGYGSLSLKAIRKINPWLEAGHHYGKAVFLANIPYLLEKDIWVRHKDALVETVLLEIDRSKEEKSLISITNILIKRYNDLPYTHRFAAKDHVLDEDDRKDIRAVLIDYFGEKKWAQLPAETLAYFEEQIGAMYGKALTQASGSELSFIIPSRMDDKIKAAVSRITGVDPSDPRLEKMYHPSEMGTSPVPSRGTFATGTLLLKNPVTGGMRNPMAIRALFELKKLINHLLRHELIDERTYVIVEMARELNDANRRKAIERYQQERRDENAQYEQRIRKIFASQHKTLPSDLSVYIERYRLREEQPRQACMYTGRTISDTDLFDELTTDIEHTLPRSLSFDDSLENKTIAFKYYNSRVKRRMLPSQLPNYSIHTKDYSAIAPRLMNWLQRVEDYQLKIEQAKGRSRMATAKEVRDKAIQDRHYYDLHLRYWKNKVERFVVTQVPAGFSNGQLADTQIIAKYGVMYLKTLFYRVRSTKGVITDGIKKIWGAIGPDEKKDRDSHAHHAVDAIIQTLLHKERTQPDVYSLLARSYREAERDGRRELKLPNPWTLRPAAFYAAIQQLTAHIIVYHVNRDHVLKQTKKKLRKKGQVVCLPDSTPMYGQGRGIRASLHKDTFYGAIKVPVLENGKFRSDEKGRLILEKDEKGQDLLKFRSGFVFKGNTVDAIRKNIANIVDARLRSLAESTGARTIHEQGYFEIPPSEERKKRDPHAIATKVYKVKVFTENMQNPLRIKEHVDVKRQHKQWYYAQTDGNYLMALYDNGKEKDFELINTFDLAVRAGAGRELYPPFKERVIRKRTVQLPLCRRNGRDLVLKQGVKVLLYEDSAEEIISDPSPDNLSDRLYRIQGLSIQRNKFPSGKISEYGIIQMIHHMEARKTSDLVLENGAYRFMDGKRYRKMLHVQFKALIEGIDFSMTTIGAIDFL